MSRKKAPPVFDPPPPRVLHLLRQFCIGNEVGSFDLSEPDVDLATQSRGFRALLRSSIANPKAGDLHPITLMWEWAGRPAGKSPEDWMADQWHSQKPDRAIVEDRGEAGIFADWEQASWYAHFMDPDNFTLDEVVERLYW